MAWIGEWEGGRIWQPSSGKRTYHIRRRVRGRLFEVSTRASTVKGAMESLKRFEADPENYKPEGNAGPEPIYLTPDLVEGYLDWSRDVRHNTSEWVGKQKAILAVWADALEGVDLRSASLVDSILPALSGATSYAHRVAVIKGFFSYLRKVTHQLTVAEDPVFQTLVAPPANVSQRKRSKVILREHYELAREHLVGAYRDALDVLAVTGWHVASVIRFADAGTVEPIPYAQRGQGVAGVLVVPREKDGDEHRTAVDAKTLAAAERLRAHGSLSRVWFGRAIHRACDVAKIPRFSAGRFRHTVATMAMNAGATLPEIAGYLGHRSPATTKRWYATLGVPKRIPTPLVGVDPAPSPVVARKRKRTSRA